MLREAEEFTSVNIISFKKIIWLGRSISNILDKGPISSVINNLFK
jgi:hypothetical protein